MAERFADYLHRRAAPIWEAQRQHPFVRGIGDGTLDVEQFKHWVKQDYLYLIDYARLFAMDGQRMRERRFVNRVEAAVLGPGRQRDRDCFQRVVAPGLVFGSETAFTEHCTDATTIPAQ